MAVWDASKNLLGGLPGNLLPFWYKKQPQLAWPVAQLAFLHIFKPRMKTWCLEVGQPSWDHEAATVKNQCGGPRDGRRDGWSWRSREHTLDCHLKGNIRNSYLFEAKAFLTTIKRTNATFLCKLGDTAQVSDCFWNTCCPGNARETAEHPGLCILSSRGSSAPRVEWGARSHGAAGCRRQPLPYLTRCRVLLGCFRLVSKVFSDTNTKAHSWIQILVGVQQNLSRTLHLFPPFIPVLSLLGSLLKKYPSFPHPPTSQKTGQI